EGLLDGIEVVNDLTYSDEALQIALDNNLTIMGTSDIHGLVDWQFDLAKGGHRPITLVFGTDRSPEAIREGLLNRRTIAYFNNLLIGREEWLTPLIQASLVVKKASYQGPTSVLDVILENKCDAPFILANESNYTFHADSDVILIKPHSSITIQVKTLNNLKEIELPFTVLNGIIAPKKHPKITWKVTVSE
ncbi:MAG: Sb-PDE family phosphodiesterase, partial [Saprospiraceae bacterium]